MPHASPTNRLLLVAFTALTACSGSSTAPPVVTTSFDVRQSVEQLHVTHAKPGVELVVLDASDKEVQTATADHLGSFVFRKIPPGEGYRVRAKSSPPETTGPLRVMSVANSKPAQSFYQQQKLKPGFNYIQTR